MAFCSKCGSEIKEGAKFCSKCGAPARAFGAGAAAAGAAAGMNAAQPAAPAEAPAPKAAETYSKPAPAPQPFEPDTGRRAALYTPPQTGYAPVRNNAVIETLKGYGGSVLFLVYACIVAVTIVISIIPTGGFGILAVLIMNVPGILAVIGMILAFVDCRTNETPKGSGITVYKVGKGIGIAYISIICGLILVLLILIMIMGGALISGLGGGMLDDVMEEIFGTGFYGFEGLGDLSGALIGVFIFLIVIVVVVMILGILIYTSLIKSANSIRNSLNQGKVVGSFPIYPAVMMIIAAVFTVIGLFTTIASVSMFSSLQRSIDLQSLGIPGMSAASGTMSIVSMLLGLAQLIIGAILVISLRSKMNRLRETAY